MLVCCITALLGKGCFLCVGFAGLVTGMLLLPCASRKGFFGAGEGHNAPEAK